MTISKVNHCKQVQGVMGNITPKFNLLYKNIKKTLPSFSDRFVSKSQQHLNDNHDI